MYLSRLLGKPAEISTASPEHGVKSTLTALALQIWRHSLRSKRSWRL
jgi:hypothetical protein